MQDNERYRRLDSQFVGPFAALWERLKKDERYFEQGRVLKGKAEGILSTSGILRDRLGADGFPTPHWESPEVPVDMYTTTLIEKDKSFKHTGRLQIVQRKGSERGTAYSYPRQPITIRLIEGHDRVERILFTIEPITIEPSGLVRDWMGEKAPEVGVNGLDMVKKLLDHIDQNLP